ASEPHGTSCGTGRAGRFRVGRRRSSIAPGWSALAGHRDGRDTLSTGLEERLRARGERGAGRHDIVNQDDPAAGERFRVAGAGLEAERAVDVGRAVYPIE